ncbi:MAG: hypothetical protein WBA10_12350 [Elainellaceae cyanobacterium]
MQERVLSPLLANIALHGLENDLKRQFPVRSRTINGKQHRSVPIQVIRYADDFVVMHPELEVVQGD